ncbi:MAG TPA: Cna B-type domain-containing protein [Candidatus Copromorpha excrementipullorum]|uniref:Cna B-type domain-containing protein n=1 Tax=Candidatus Allocopromorpha excrementipullorum TaxID=2840743 RepID=A0A9D1STN2_9FIRM|nr:Cna B-type domain-containing protein [Candidatus Copromorpha excrementipullorum]
MRVSAGKKFMVMMMTLVMIVTMMPGTISAAYEGGRDKEDSGTEGGADGRMITLSWKPEKAYDNAEREKVKVSLEAAYDPEKSGADSVDMEIRLEEDEAQLLMQFRDPGSELDETITVKPSAGNDISIRHGDDGALFLEFTLDRQEPVLKADLDFGKAEGAATEPGAHDVTVEAGDVLAGARYGEGNEAEPVDAENIAVDAESFTVMISDEKDLPGLFGTDSLSGKNSLSGKMTARSLSSRERVDIDERQDVQSSDIFWVDNNDEMSIRPGTAEMVPVLRFSLEGNGSFAELTADNMATLGLTQMPEVSITENGIGRWNVQIPQLPSKVTYYDAYGDVTVYDDIQWEVVPAAANGYQLTEVTREDIGSGESIYTGLTEPGWYYVLMEDIVFDLAFRKGGNAVDETVAEDVIKKNFYFNVEYRQGVRESIDLTDEEHSGRFDIDVEVDSENKNGKCSMTGVPKYNLDGTRITYSMEDKFEDEDKILVDDFEDVPGFEKGDYYSIIYDNTAVPGFSAQTDQLYDGGTMYLTLAGTRDYEAAKIWLDDGEDETVDNRPTGEFQLWRYREGSSYTTAAPVRDGTGDIMSIELDSSGLKDPVEGEDGFDSQKLQFEDLPKYDTEGYSYYYVLREYLDTTDIDNEAAQNYIQVFGGVNGYHDTVEGVEITGEDPDNEPRRQEGNTFLYNGGIILNRIDESTSVSVSKIWNAAAFQAAFDGVKIEMTLYSKSEDDERWESTGKTRTMEDFSAEISVDDISETVPKYDEFGQQLQYIWRETGVYQGDEKIELTVDEENFLKAFFVLRQDGRDVEYTSLSETDEETGDTVITNSIANTVKYTVDKKWYDEDGKETDPPEDASVKFAIYRVINGEDITSDKKVAEFTMDGEADEEAEKVNEELGISVREESPWNAVVSPLVEFDENGNQYEYVLLEMAGEQAYIPEYEVTKDQDGDYYATVINKPGSGQRIMVRKNWNDNSDIAHREPVTITAYDKTNPDEPLGSVTLGQTDGDGSQGAWYDWLSIPADVDQDDVYILETQVGDTDIPADKDLYDSWTGDAPVLDTGSNNDYSTLQYQAENHKYEVSYSVETVEGLKFYTAENRRLGNVDLTVTKEWTDGDGSQRQAIAEELKRIKKESSVDIRLAIELDFHDSAQYNANHGDYKVGNDKDGNGYVSIGRKESDVAIYDNEGNRVSYRQTVDFTDDQKIYFYNLPKYDANSDIVRYDIREVWIEDGKEISRGDIENKYENLYSLIADYSTRYAEGEYQIVDNHGKPDVQTIGVENYLSGAKDIKWKKLWHDLYNYENSLRPDIYLDIYSVSHYEEDGAIKEQTQVYQRDYRWTFDDELTDQGGQYSREHYWLAQIEGVPKYDALGYEMTYYAIEKTIVDRGSFDYTDVYYLDPNHDGTDEDVTSEDYIGSEYEVTEAAIENGYVQNVSDVESGDGYGTSHYALIEEGTFNNHLDRYVEVTAEKLWSSLPAGYDMKDLPTATFTLYRQLASDSSGDPATDGKKIAEITIKGSDWADISRNGSYRFQFLYEGVNEYNFGEDGEMVITPEDENASRLQKYDEDGNLWRYTVVETSMATDIQGSGSNITGPDFSKVFDQAGSSSGVVIENTYDNEENLGSLSVKKLLYLPMAKDGERWAPEAYPAVTFELTRTYTKNDGTTSPAETVDTMTWSSEAVRDEYESQAGGLLSKIASFFTGDPVTVNGSQVDENGDFEPLEKVITFEALEIYAPNGSPYVYTVKEVKSSLNGYDTWAVEGDVAIEYAETKMTGEPVPGDPATGELTPAADSEDGTEEERTIAATFINRQDTEREIVTVSGQKNWNDYDDVFGTRPDEITLTLYRQADSQPGQSNSIGKTEVSDGLYSVIWDETSGNVWTYTITGKQVAVELEKYAPNGMPWKYSVRETLADTDGGAAEIYDMTPAGGETSAKGAAGDSGEITLGHLTNSMMTSTSFSKTWVDSDGDVIDEDLLGVELSVDFTLQVAEVTKGEDSQEQISEWSDAETYFRTNLGWIDDNGRSAYENVFGEDGEYQFTQTKTGHIDDDEVWGKDNRGSFSGLPGYIKKDSSSAETTQLTYRVVERKIRYEAGENTVIQNVNVTADEGTTYKLEFPEASVGDEDAGAFDGPFAPAYPDGDGWSSDGAYNDSDSDFANMLKTTEMAAKKIWQGDDNNAYGTREETGRGDYDWEVTFVVQQRLDGDEWSDVMVNGEGGETPLTITIYGTDLQTGSDVVTFSGLPETGLTGGTYQYRIRELDTDDTVIDGTAGNDRYNTSYEVDYDREDGVTTVTNRLETTRIYADKIWNKGIKDKQTLTFELKYLDEDGETWRSFVPAATVTLDGIPELAQTVPGSLPAVGASYGEYDSWRASWSNVPLVMAGSSLDNDGHTIYTVVEKDTGRYLIETTGGDKNYDGEKYHTFDISNNEKTSLTVEKSWLGVEPDALKEVTASIYRAAVTDEELEAGKLDGDSRAEAVPGNDGGEMTVTLNKGNGWNVTIEDLPKYDGEGKTYVYFARETVIGGEEPPEDELYISYKNGRDPASGDYSTRIINVGRTDIEGSKTWKDNGGAYGTRPDDVELKLYRATAEGEPALVDADTMKEEGIAFRWANKDGDRWSYQYTGLPVTDSRGNEYAYSVKEAEEMEAGDGDVYRAGSEGTSDNGYALTNTLTDTIDIPVEKVWTDSDDKGGTRPDSIRLVLCANGEEYREATVERPDTDDGRWAYTFEGLPEYDEDGVRIEYTVAEKEVPDGYDVRVDGMTVENVARGGLTVTKTVKGNAGDKDKEFTFIVTLDNENITGLYGDMEFEDGKARFTISDGESLSADGLPGGTGYSVREEEGGSDGYVTRSENSEGTIPAGDIITVKYINSKDIPPADGSDTDTKTGDDTSLAIPAAVMAASLAAIAAVLAGIRRKSRK